MNRRSLMVGLLLLVILAGVLVANHRRSTRTQVTLVPPTGQEPMAPVGPMMPGAPLQPVAPVVTPPVAAALPAAQPRGRDRRFWGNRGYVVKDAQSTFIPPAQREQLKREYLQQL